MHILLRNGVGQILEQINPRHYKDLVQEEEGLIHLKLMNLKLQEVQSGSRLYIQFVDFRLNLQPDYLLY